MRQDAVPWAYRVFSRQVGIDPDTDRTPVERIALERLRHGGLREPEPARRRAHDRDRRDRRAGDRARRRPRRAASSGCAWPRAGERLGGRAAAVGAPDRGRRRRRGPWRSCSARSSHDAGVTPRRRAHAPVRPAGEGRAARSRRGGAVDRRRRCCCTAAASIAGVVPDVLQPERRPFAARRDASGRARRAPHAARAGRPARGRARRSCSARSGRARASTAACPAAAGRACCRWPSSRSCATTSPRACQHARRALSDRTYVEEQNRRLIEEMLLDPEAHKWVRVSQRGHRRARLQALARAPALGLPRHADGLVAGGHHLRLSVSHLTSGRRSRKRGGHDARAPSATPRAARARPRPEPPARAGRPPRDERPPAPWGSFPLSELVILLGIVVIVWGFLSGGDRAASAWPPGSCSPRSAAASWRCASTWPASARTPRCSPAWPRSWS